MDPNSKEWKIWCKLDKYWRSRDKKEIENLSEDEIKKTLACAQPSDRGRAGAYLAGDELLKELEKSKEKNEKKKKTYRRVIIGAVGIVLIAIFFHGEIDFKKTVIKILDPFGLLALKDSSEKNEPIVLEALFQEFKQNTQILKDITYDKQYVNGKMGSQLWNMSFSAYESALSKGVIADKKLAIKLQQIYTGVFKIADNTMRETRGANAEQQIRLYELIGLNYKASQRLLKEVQQQLEEYSK